MGVRWGVTWRVLVWLVANLGVQAVPIIILLANQAAIAAAAAGERINLRYPATIFGQKHSGQQATQDARTTLVKPLDRVASAVDGAEFRGARQALCRKSAAGDALILEPRASPTCPRCRSAHALMVAKLAWRSTPCMSRGLVFVVWYGCRKSSYVRYTSWPFGEMAIAGKTGRSAAGEAFTGPLNVVPRSVDHLTATRSFARNTPLWCSNASTSVVFP